MSRRWWLVHGTAAALVFACLPDASDGAVTFSRMPRTLQLYGRDAQSDSGTVVIAGNAPGFHAIQVRAYRNNQAITGVGRTVDADSAFACSLKIKAELAVYRFEVSGNDGSTDTDLAVADSVVCGDVFIVQGQSNAVASGIPGTTDSIRSPYIRVFGSGNPDQFDSSWHVAQGDGDEWSPGNTGQWGLRLARSIVDSQHIPVAIFSGSRGGRALSFFQRIDTNTTVMTSNYGRLLTRLRMTGLTGFVRAVAWNQGESDMTGGGGTATESYISRFRDLRDDWVADYPGVEKIYVFQLTPGVNCCTVDNAGPIKEAQRRMPQVIPGVEVMSTSGADHYDACHYLYENGYERFGRDLYRQIARDLYGSSDTANIDPPAIESAELTDSLHIVLTMQNPGDSLIWNPGSEASFRLEGVDTAAVRVIAGRTEGNCVVLTLSANPIGLAAITYKGDAFPDSMGRAYCADPMVRNLNGVSALHFWQFPVSSSAVRCGPGATPRRGDPRYALVAVRGRRGITLTGDNTVRMAIALDGRIVRAEEPGARISTLRCAGGRYVVRRGDQ